MADVISTAGAAPEAPTSPEASPRREAIRVIRTVLRNQAASEDEVDDALEALIELSKD